MTVFRKNAKNKEVQIEINETEEIGRKMDEFLDKVDALCWEYGYEINPFDDKTIVVSDGKETIRLTSIDGDGRGK